MSLWATRGRKDQGAADVSAWESGLGFHWPTMCCACHGIGSAGNPILVVMDCTNSRKYGQIKVSVTVCPSASTSCCVGGSTFGLNLNPAQYFAEIRIGCSKVLKNATRSNAKNCKSQPPSSAGLKCDESSISYRPSDGSDGSDDIFLGSRDALELSRRIKARSAIRPFSASRSAWRSL